MPDVIGSLIGGSTLGGNAIGAAVVRLRLDSDDYQRQMAAAKGETTAAANSMGTTTSKFGAVAKAAFLGVGAAAVAGVAISIKAASDLNEQLNKSREVFGKASESVIAFSKTTAEGLGIAQSEALEAAGNFGQLFDAAGFASKAAADMSQKMVTLGADLGSFNNIPVAEALEKIRSGLSGEAEPLRQLGVFLSEARVEAEAFSSGIAKQGDELTDAQKIQARYNIILQDTVKAQGDFARTVGESVPNQLKVLKATLTDTAANFGTALLPVVLDVVKAFQIVIPLLKIVANNIDLVVIALAGFAGVKFVPALLGAIEKGLIAVQVASGASLTAQGAVTAAFAGGTTAVVGFTTAMAAVPLVAFKIAEAIAPVDAGMEALNERMKTFGVVRGPAMQEAADRLGERMAEMQQKADLASQGILNLGGATIESTEKFKQAQDKIKNFAHLTDEELKEWRGDVKESFHTAIFALQDFTTESDITKRDVIVAFREMKKEARETAKAMTEISHEHWINDDFRQFISEQAPGWITAFAELSKEKQKKIQEDFDLTTGFAKKFNEALNNATGVLGDLNKGSTRHKVVIEYDYVGFDPTKPGMRAGQTGGATSGQQR